LGLRTRRNGQCAKDKSNARQRHHDFPHDDPLPAT
jgi:hypothetical protein